MFYICIWEVFGVLEEVCFEGKFSVYGIVIWNGFWVVLENCGYFFFEELVVVVWEVGMLVGSMVEKNIFDYVEDVFYIFFLCWCEIVFEYEIWCLKMNYNGCRWWWILFLGGLIIL